MLSLEVIDLSKTPYSDFDCLYLIPISDLHIGDPAFNEEKLRGYLEWVLERPNAFILLLGDILNTATKDSLSDIYKEKLKIPEACQRVWELFEPVQDRVLGWIEGNHERRLYKQVGGYLGELICSRYKWRFFPESAFLKLRFGKQKNGKPVAYIIYALHGWGGGRTSGAKINKLEELGKICLADLYLIAHHHRLYFSQDIFFIPDTRNNSVIQSVRTFVATGCFRDYADYEVRCGLKAPRIGAPRIRLDATRKDIHVSF